MHTFSPLSINLMATCCSGTVLLSKASSAADSNTGQEPQSVSWQGHDKAQYLAARVCAKD